MLVCYFGRWFSLLWAAFSHIKHILGRWVAYRNHNQEENTSRNHNGVGLIYLFEYLKKRILHLSSFVPLRTTIRIFTAFSISCIPLVGIRATGYSTFVISSVERSVLFSARGVFSPFSRFFHLSNAWELDFATLGNDAVHAHVACLRPVTFFYWLFSCIIDGSSRYLQYVSIAILCLFDWEILILVGVVVWELDFVTLGNDAVQSRSACLRPVAFFYWLFFCIIGGSVRYLQFVSIVIFCSFDWRMLILVGVVVWELDFVTLGTCMQLTFVPLLFYRILCSCWVTVRV